MCKMIIGISWIRYCIFAVGKFCLFKNNNKKGYNYAKTFLSFSAGERTYPKVLIGRMEDCGVVL